MLKGSTYSIAGTDATSKRIPIRAVHTGTDPNIADRQVTRIYDYYEFRSFTRTRFEVAVFTVKK